MRYLVILGGLLAGTLALPHGTRTPTPMTLESILANSNTHPAGRLADGVLTLALEARSGRWFPGADDGPSVETQAFAEAGGPLLNPGPLIRVVVGTTVRLSIRNRLSSPLVMHGVGSRPSSQQDSLIVPPGSHRRVRFRLNAAGTYYYWGSTTGTPVDGRDGIDSQLSGAIVVDPIGGPRTPTDRVFVLGVWFRDADSTGPNPTPFQEIMVINGKSWPHTERIELTQGDTVRWRWVNPTASSHPMHLHGFYFEVESRGDAERDTLFAPQSRPLEVTELMLPGGTMAMTWSPERAGNWLFHCHFSFHISPEVSLPEPEENQASADLPASAHQHHRMAGLVLGLHVAPRPGAMPLAKPARPVRDIRLLVQTRPGRFGTAAGFGYLLPQGSEEPAHDSIAIPGPVMVLERGAPVRITVVNHLAEPTAVHWHGIELESFPDGVPGWSGSGQRLMLPIAPGDSFAAEFTPPRAGTFIYHTHVNELLQLNLGLYGPLLVLEPGARFDPATDHIVIASPDGESSDTVGGWVNGSATPEPIVMRVGEAHRLRLINIHGDYRVQFTLEDAGRIASWRPLAKDGAIVPPGLATTRPARLLTGPGETADYEVRFESPGERILVVEAPFADRPWKLMVPIRVQPAAGQ